MKFRMLAAVALALALPVDGQGQAKGTARSWLECLGPDECEVRVGDTFRSRKGKVRILAARAGSACLAAGYSHYVEAGTTRSDTGLFLIQRVYFTDETGPPARPCSFSARAELVDEAKEIARVKDCPWPVGEVTAEVEGWTFEPGENDWGEALPFLDEIASPIVPALRSDQKDLVGAVVLERNCVASD